MATVPRTAPAGRRPRRRGRRLTRRDRIVLAVMVGVPAALHIALVWVPTLGSIALSFSRWEGVGGFDTIQWIRTLNYRQIFTIYPPFWPAVRHNFIWLGFLFLATGFGLFLAVQLDKRLRMTRLYQSIIFLPVMLSLAIVGFIWRLVYSHADSLLNNLLGTHVVVLVITAIESLLAFDLVYVINRGTNGLELVSVLVTNNIVGEASRIGYGSALAVILLVVSLVFIIPYLVVYFRGSFAGRGAR